MRVGLIRQDIGRLYLDDLENTSQRNFSSQPAGQSRFLEYPSDATLTSILNQWAFLSILGSGAVFPLTLTGGNNTLSVVAVTGGPTVTMTIATGSYTAVALAAAINAAFANNGLANSVVASVQGGQIQIDTVAPGAAALASFQSVYTGGAPQPPIGYSPQPPSPAVSALNSGPTAFLHVTGTLASALSLSSSSLTGLSVAALKTGVYVYTTVSGQTGSAASLVAGPAPGIYTVTGLTGMTVNSVLHVLTIGNSGSSNNGTYQIVKYNSATSVNISQISSTTALTVPDANNASLTWAEKTISFNIAYSQIGGLSTFTTMEGYSASTPTGSFLNLATAIQNAVAPGIIETGPALLSFAKGKLGKLVSTTFQPGSGVSSLYPFGEGAPVRLNSVTGAAVFISANDGHTAFTL